SYQESFLGSVFLGRFVCSSDRVIRMCVTSVVVGPCPSSLPTNPLLRPPEPIQPGARPRLKRSRSAPTFAVTSSPAATPIPVGSRESQLRVWASNLQTPFIANLQLGTA